MRHVVIGVVFLALLAVPSGIAGNVPPIDPDQGAKQGNDAVVVVRQFGNQHFEILVQNTSSIGFINSFQWVPPPGMTVTKITKVSTGKCNIVAGNIACVVKLKPPKCTCRPGGSMTIDFNATGRDPTTQNGHPLTLGVMGSFLRIEKVTPVPYHIPSWIGGEPTLQPDLPLCKVGQTSTKAHPCTKRR